MQSSYDLEGNRTVVYVPALGYRVVTQYDANHRPTRMTTDKGEIWIFNYDSANRRTRVVYPDDSVKFTFVRYCGLGGRRVGARCGVQRRYASRQTKAKFGS